MRQDTMFHFWSGIFHTNGMWLCPRVTLGLKQTVRSLFSTDKINACVTKLINASAARYLISFLPFREKLRCWFCCDTLSRLSPLQVSRTRATSGWRRVCSWWNCRSTRLWTSCWRNCDTPSTTARTLSADKKTWQPKLPEVMPGPHNHNHSYFHPHLLSHTHPHTSGPSLETDQSPSCSATETKPTTNKLNIHLICCGC